LTTMGIYLMSTEEPVHRGTVLPPYVNEARTGLNANVPFYSLGTTSDSGQLIAGVNASSNFNENPGEVDYKMVYSKTAGTGYVRSIILGRAHATPAQAIEVGLNDANLPADFKTSTNANYILNHEDGTTMYKTIGTNGFYTANIKKKLYSSATNATAYANINSYFGAIEVGDTIYKVAKQAATGTNYTVRLTYVPNWKSATAATTLDVVIPTEIAVNTVTLPVLVYKNPTTLEAFVTPSIGAHAAGNGGNLKKIVYDITDPAAITTTIEDVGIYPFSISSVGATNALYNGGLYANNTYYLPIHHILTGGAISHTASATYVEGVSLLEVDNSVDHRFLYKIKADTSMHPIIGEAGAVMYLTANVATPRFVTASQVISGVVLDNTI
jgi:hypothetical protein